MKYLLLNAIILVHFISFSQQTIVATSDGTKYKEWGVKPLELEDEPTPPWTWDHMMCDAPFSEWVSASSTLAAQGKFSYSIENICDDDPKTAWVEGAEGDGIGEYIEFTDWVPMGDGVISILNGYQYSKSSWESNNRVKKFSLSLNGKLVCYIELQDVMGIQRFSLPENVLAEIRGTHTEIETEGGGYIVYSNEDGGGVLRFTIVEVYHGTKYKDTCITGIFSCGG